MKRISLENMTYNLRQAVVRMPLAVISLAVLFVLLILQNHHMDLNWKVYVALTGGIVWSVSATLFCETKRTRKTTYLASAVAYALWTVYVILLPSDDHFTTSTAISFGAICTAGVLSMIFAPFLWSQENETSFWNFAKEILLQGFTAMLFACILAAGLSGALYAIDSLFSLKFNSMLYGDIMLFCYVLFAPLYFLCKLPVANQCSNEVLEESKLLKNLSLYILLPLVAIYFCILYLYLFKIIVQWTLPHGTVTWLVTVSMLLYFFIVTFSYPLHVKGSNKLAVLTARYMGIVALPLLILMSVGIIYRIGEYGITISRGYVLLLNIWFYAMVALLTITHSRKIKWILISFAVLFVLSSIGPWSVSSITYRSILSSLKESIAKSGAYKDGTFDGKLFDQYLAADSLQEDNLESKDYYMRNYYGKDYQSKMFVENTEEAYASFYESLHGYPCDTDKNMDETIALYYHLGEDGETVSTNGLQYYRFILTPDHACLENDSIVINKLDGHPDIVVPMDDIRQYVLTEGEKAPFVYTGSDYAVHLKHIDGTYYPKETENHYHILSFQCYLFYNKQ